MKFVLNILLFSCCCLGSAVAQDTPSVPDALLIVAHGASPTWNQQVIDLAAKVDWPGAKGVAFLMQATPEHEFPAVLKKLDGTGAKRIIVVPLLVSSFSNHYEEIRYYAGLRRDAPEHAHYSPTKTRAEVVVTNAMDDNRQITEILASRARSLSRDPNAETLVLVAHGPNDEEENRIWLEKLKVHAEGLNKEHPFKRIHIATLRDDAPKPVRDAATGQLREFVRTASADSRVLVVPVLISVGLIQKQIQERLRGLTYEMVEFGIASDPQAALWVQESAKAYSAKYKQTGSNSAQ